MIICIIRKMLLSLQRQLRNISQAQKSITMATIEEWWEYYKELQEKLEEIQKSNLPKEIKQELTDIYLDKMSIVKKYFLE